MSADIYGARSDTNSAPDRRAMCPQCGRILEEGACTRCDGVPITDATVDSFPGRHSRLRIYALAGELRIEVNGRLLNAVSPEDLADALKRSDKGPASDESREGGGVEQAVERLYQQHAELVRAAPAACAAMKAILSPSSREGGGRVDLDELERLMAGAWAAPWVARSFEIDCPCPNGEDCGDLHSCEEVEAPEAYPDSHEKPAKEGEGQCVVQISVPGLESLSRPTAEFIAAIRNAAPALIAELRARRAREGER